MQNDSIEILKVEGLVKQYGNSLAVDHLNLSVNKGDVYGFLGPNGAGKSTTIRMLLQLIKPSSGKISIFGKDLKENRSEILSKIGSIVEKPDFYRYLSAEDNLRIFGNYSGLKLSTHKIYELLDFVGLNGSEKSLVKTYSHGMKQRLGIAQTLLNDPELIILDEPTTGLDPAGIIELRNWILELQQKGKTIFLSSHILSEIELIANRMIIINKGKAVMEGSRENLLSKNELTVSFKLIGNWIQMLEKIKSSQWIKHLKMEEEKNHKLIFSLSEQETIDLNKYLCEANIGVAEISSTTKLEDLFLQLTKSSVAN